MFRIKQARELVVALYAPSGREKNEQRKTFFEKINKLIEKKNTEKDPIILTGDFNNTMQDLDRSEKKNIKCPSQYALNEILNMNDLVDMWR